MVVRKSDAFLLFISGSFELQTRSLRFFGRDRAILMWSKLSTLFPSFVKDSTDPLHTKIYTESALSTFKNFFTDTSEKISADFPTKLHLIVLETIMTNNIFNFANTYWIQLSGTAMDTPAACAYAAITFGHYENTEILLQNLVHTYFFRRYINYIFGVWIPPAKKKI